MTTYATDSQGKFIPSTQRPDGTWRKPRRVRDGYVPQEEVPLYESKGKLFAQKPLLPPGMSPEMAQKSKEKREREQRIKQQREATDANRRPPHNPVPGLLILNGDSKINQPQQRGGAKPAKPKKKAVELPDVLLEQKQKEEQKQARQQQSQQKSQKDHKNSKLQPERIEEVAKAMNGLQLTNNHVGSAAAAVADGLQTDLSKKLRKLRKKIREIEIIEERLRSNDGGPRPDKDQIDKAKRKPEILKEIEELERGIAK